MSLCTQSGSVIDKVKKKIQELEQAIQRLDFIKRHLSQSSSEIKSQIHSSISRHLETLRNREVRLLEEVDTVVGSKEEILHRQQARLNKTLGVLHSSLAHATSAGSDDETAVKHLVQALEQLNSADLKAEETPYVAFRADHGSLRESILNYGRVDAKGQPIFTAFASKPSASLPRHLEEYEDTEHHVFYKALQGSSQVCVTMPKFSSRVEDWLQRPILQLSTSAELPRSPVAESAGTPVSQTTCAIQNWLSQIKHNPDVEEEDDFEIVDHSGSSQRESPVEEEKPLAESAERGADTSMFQHISRDLNLWLLKGSVQTSGPSAEELRAFFKHIPRDTSMWLIKARHQLESLDELKNGNWFRNIPTDMSTWLKRSHERRTSPLTQTSLPDLFSHISKDRNFWLKKESAALLNDEQEKLDEKKLAKACSLPADLEKFLMKGPPGCAAMSVPNPIEVYISLMPSEPSFWLHCADDGNAGAASAAASAVVEEAASSVQGTLKFLNSNTNNISAWLARPTVEEGKASPCSSTTFFSHIPASSSEWLFSPVPKYGSFRAQPEQALRSADGYQWLDSTSAAAFMEGKTTSTLPSSPIDSLYHYHSQFTTSDWLLGKGYLSCKSPVTSEKSWATCSTESSVSSVSTASSLHLPPSPAAVTSQSLPAEDLAAWIFQKSL